jgi:hypothetical protein
VNGVERPELDVREAESHVMDHGALWEAVIYLNRRVMQLENLLDGEE